MDFTRLIIWIGDWMPVFWTFMFGACVGSLINVLAYRLPLGMDCVSPSSRCPACDTKLTWRENIPILGWILLRGKCRFCRSEISPQYPIIEAFVAVLWATTAALWYALPNYGQSPFGVPWTTFKPEWAMSGFAATWPIFLTVLSLFSCLVAMTLTDLKSFTIPLVLPWFATAFALAVHPLWALYVQQTSGDLFTLRGTGWVWSIATPATVLGEQAGAGQTAVSSWWWLGASIGGSIGIGVALVLLKIKVIGRSFSDYDAWENAETARVEAEFAARAGTPGLTLRAGDAAEMIDPTMLWTAYPHARREMIKELAFLAPCGLLGWLGGTLTAGMATRVGEVLTISGGVILTATMPPLWLNVLSGVVLGYLVGGGLVWLVRILGSVGFNKEAMGLGDVHLLAAVGATMGWIDAVLTFFTAAFVGLAWTLIAAVASRSGPRRTLPFGPSLAIGCFIVVFAKPLFEWFLGRIMHADGPLSLP